MSVTPRYQRRCWHRQVCCLSPKPPDLAANSRRTSTGREEGAPWQADRPANGGTQLTAGEGLVLVTGKEDAQDRICPREEASREPDHVVWLQSCTPARQSHGGCPCCGHQAILGTPAAHPQTWDVIPRDDFPLVGCRVVQSGVLLYQLWVTLGVQLPRISRSVGRHLPPLCSTRPGNTGNYVSFPLSRFPGSRCRV